MPDWKQYVRQNLQLRGVEPQREAEVVDELAQQLDEAYREGLRRGLSDAEAAREARQHIRDWQALGRDLQGSVRLAASPLQTLDDRLSDAGAAGDRVAALISGMTRDVLFALRMMRKNAGFTLVAVLTLALGIGANGAVFSVIESTLLRPLPFRSADQLVAVQVQTKATSAAGGYGSMGISAPDFEDLRQGQTTFQAMSMWISQSVNYSGREHPDRVIGAFVSANFFDMMEVAPLLGRSFAPGEDKPGTAPVVMLAYAAWQTQFGGSPDVVGSAMTLNGESYTVIGVLPPWFAFPWGDSDVWMPISHYPNYRWDRNYDGQAVVGRIKDGVSRQQATADLDRIAQRLSREFHQNVPVQVVLTRLKDLQVRNIRPTLLVLSCAVFMILLIACANLGSVLLARGAARAQEVAIRMALGASRGRIVSQLVAEFVAIALVACVASLLVARQLLGYLLRMRPLPPELTPHIDAGVMAFAFGMALVVGIALGVAPAIHLSRRKSGDVALSTVRGSGADSGGARLRAGMVVAQVGISLMLLAGSALLVQSFRELLSVQPGFRSDHLLTMEYRLPKNHYATREAQWNFHRTMLQRVQQVPGVMSAAIVQGLPFSGNGGSGRFALEGQAVDDPNSLPSAQTNLVTPEYFATMEIPVLRGRGIEESDTADKPIVAVINQTMARKYWPKGDALGQSVRVPAATFIAGAIPAGFDATVVGVVADAKQFDLRDAMEPQMYFAYAQQAGIFGTLVVRTAGNPMSLADPVRKAVWSVDKDQPVWKVRTLEMLLDRDVAPSKYLMGMISMLGVIALALTAVGTYGLISYTVSRRTQEIGVRMALGATPRAVVQLMLQQGLRLVGAGVVLGLVGAVAARGLLRGILYGVSASDPWILAMAVALIAAAAVLASYVPSRRAARLDPLEALRCE